MCPPGPGGRLYCAAHAQTTQMAPRVREACFAVFPVLALACWMTMLLAYRDAFASWAALGAFAACGAFAFAERWGTPGASCCAFAAAALALVPCVYLVTLYATMQQTAACGTSSCPAFGEPYNACGLPEGVDWRARTDAFFDGCRFADFNGLPPVGYWDSVDGVADLARPCSPPDETGCTRRGSSRCQDYPDGSTGVALGLFAGTVNDLAYCPASPSGAGRQVCTRCAWYFAAQARQPTAEDCWASQDPAQAQALLAFYQTQNAAQWPPCWMYPGARAGEVFTQSSVQGRAALLYTCMACLAAQAALAIVPGFCRRDKSGRDE